jgi:hypothetical protein
MRIPSMASVQLVALVAIATIAAGRAPEGLAQTAMVRAPAFETTWSGDAFSFSHRTSARPLRREQGKAIAVSLTGRWYWRANCPGASFSGGAYIVQHSPNRFSGRLANTNQYDRGAISDGRLRGRNASFTLNAFGRSARLGAVLVVSPRGGLEARAAYATPQFGRCHLRFTRI